MNKLLLSFSIILFFASCTVDNTQTVAVENIAKEIRTQFVPDRRVAIFDIKVNTTKNGIIIGGETNLPEAKKALLERLSAENISVIDSLLILPANHLGENTYGIVRLSACNIRSNPKHSAELATQSTLGTPLRVYKEAKEKKDWYYVQTPDGYLGWLDLDGFELMNKETFDAWLSAPKVIIQTDFAKAYEAANMESTVVSDLIAGNILLAKGIEGDFEKVEFPDGRQGFVLRRFRADYNTWLSAAIPDTSRIINCAKQMLGYPYLWGGTSRKGMDCSGYTKTVFYENGILLPRDASQQVHIGEEIETDTTLRNLRQGDLLFFGQKATTTDKEKIRHVAIYMGNGQIIHSAGNVKIQSLIRGTENFAEDRLHTFLRAKRILGSEGKNGVKWLKDLDVY